MKYARMSEEQMEIVKEIGEEGTPPFWFTEWDEAPEGAFAILGSYIFVKMDIELIEDDRGYDLYRTVTCFEISSDKWHLLFPMPADSD